MWAAWGDPQGRAHSLSSNSRSAALPGTLRQAPTGCVPFGANGATSDTSLNPLVPTWKSGTISLILESPRFAKPEDMGRGIWGVAVHFLNGWRGILIIV